VKDVRRASRPALALTAAMLATAGALLFPATGRPAFPGANGRIAFVSDRDGNAEIYSANPDGSDPQRLTANTVPDTDPAVSADGSRIAFTRQLDIWVMNADGSDQHAVTGTEGGDSAPAWSPDGTKLVFGSNRNNPDGSTTGRQLWIMNADGSGVRKLTTGLGASLAPAWSPEGDQIAFHSNQDGEFEIYTIAAASVPGETTDARVKLTNNNLQDQNPSWSPDGARIAFERGGGTNVGDATKEIYAMDANGDNAAQLTFNADYDVQPAWSPDGARIAFESDAGADGDREILSMPATPGGVASNVTSTTSSVQDTQPDWGTPAPEPEPTPTPTETPPAGGGGGGGGGSAGGGGVPGVPPGESRPSCSTTVEIGFVEVVGCFTRTGDKYVASGNARVNGLDFVPLKGGGGLTVDPDNRKISTGENQYAIKAGDVVLRSDKVDWDLPRDVGRQDISVPDFGAPALSVVKGLPVVGDVSVKFTRAKEAVVAVPVGIPLLSVLRGNECKPNCFNITGQAGFKTSNARGLQGDALKVSAENLFISTLHVKKFVLGYDVERDIWEGAATLVLPTPQKLLLAGAFAMERGKFKRASAEVSGLNVPVAGGVFLQRVKLAVAVDPLELGGGIGITAGGLIAGKSALRLDGDFSYRFSDPGRFKADGTLKMVDFDVASGFVTVWTTGAVDFGGRILLALPNPAAAEPAKQPVFVQSELDGWVDSKGFNVEAAAQTYLMGVQLTRAEVLASNVGLAACGQLLWMRAGFGYRWAGQVLNIMGQSCDVGPYRATRARISQSGATRLSFTGDEPVVIRIDGQGGAPDVALSGPGGFRITTPLAPSGAPGDARHILLQDEENDTTYVALRHPRGSWSLETMPGSAPIRGVQTANTLAPPKVTARVTGRGASRTLTWRLRRLPGQRVRFVEDGPDVKRVLTTTSSARGRVRFSPAFGSAGRRDIVAIVEQNGMPRDSITVARYSAPRPPKPERPRRLRAKRRGSAVVATWRAGRGSASQRVVVQRPRNRRDVLVLKARARKLRIADVDRDERVVVEVAGLRQDNVPGPAAKATVKVKRRRR
jgi:Tol biopolymer transport system component